MRARAAAALVGGQLVGEDRELRTVAPLDRAGPDDLAYATGPLPAGCAAGVLLATRPTAGRTVIVVADPRAAFAKLLHALFPEVHAPGVHPGVGPGCEIGADTVLFPNVVVYPGTRVGPGCRVHAGAVLGADGFSTVADGGRPLRVPQVGRLVLGARVDVGANTCIDRGALDDTVVEDDVKLDDLVLIGHNCHLGRGALVAGQAGLGGSTSVGAGAVLGGQVGTADHARIGAGARVAAGAGIASRVPAGETWMGRPAGPASRTRRAWAALRHLPELVGDVRALAKRVSSLEQARRDD